MTSKASPEGTLSYSGDTHGRMAQMRSSNSNVISTQFLYDADERLSQVTEEVGNISGDALNQLTNLGVVRQSYRDFQGGRIRGHRCSAMDLRWERRAIVQA